MAVYVPVVRLILLCAALIVGAGAWSSAEARGRHHSKHHFSHSTHHHHRAHQQHHARHVERVAPVQQEGGWQQSDGGWGGTRQGWGDPSGAWAGGATGWYESRQWNKPERFERRQPVAAAAPAGGGLKAMVARHAAAAGVPFALADAVVKIESGYNPRARNRSGAMGLMQIKTQTARGQGFAGGAQALLNPETNLRYAMRYLATAYRMSGGDVCGTVMRYQSGHFARRMSGADRSYCGRARRLMASA